MAKSRKRKAPPKSDEIEHSPKDYVADTNPTTSALNPTTDEPSDVRPNVNVDVEEMKTEAPINKTAELSSITEITSTITVALNPIASSQEQAAADEPPNANVDVDVEETTTEAPIDIIAKPPTSATKTTSTITSKAENRLARFKALQARQVDSKKDNFKEAKKEARRDAIDPAALHSLNRKRDFASHNLLKAETEAAGKDFERQRAWDWTVEESEKWDKSRAKKEEHRQDVAFQDYTQDSHKAYKHKMRNFQPDVEAYQKQKMEAIEKAVANGGLELVETDGELIAVDHDGSFYSTADTDTFSKKRPDKAGVDRLVAELRKAEDARMKSRRERLAKEQEDSGDTTYINLKNKQFNEKLQRFYDKYTADIRESFERGTAI